MMSQQRRRPTVREVLDLLIGGELLFYCKKCQLRPAHAEADVAAAVEAAMKELEGKSAGLAWVFQLARRRRVPQRPVGDLRAHRRRN